MTTATKTAPSITTRPSSSLPSSLHASPPPMRGRSYSSTDRLYESQSLPVQISPERQPSGLAAQSAALRLPRRLSPGLVARMKLLSIDQDKSRVVSSPALGKDKIGRIPESHIRELDILHQRLSSSVEVIQRKGQAWRQTSSRLVSTTRSDCLQDHLSDLGEVSEGEEAWERHDSMPAAELRRLPEAVFGQAPEDISLHMSSHAPSAMNNLEIISADSLKYRLPDHVSGSHSKILASTERIVHICDADPALLTPLKHSPASPTSSNPPSASPLTLSLPPAYSPPAYRSLNRSSEFSDEILAYFDSLTTGFSTKPVDISFSGQIARLTALQLPEESSLLNTIASVPSSIIAEEALDLAATQIESWIHQVQRVLSRLKADDDIEWAAAGGRQGLGDVEAAIVHFEQLVNTYVGAIEEFQRRPDISTASSDTLKRIVAQMESILADWRSVQNTLKTIKGHGELALEWEELWGVILGDIGQEMESLGYLVFEMEEKRHAAAPLEPNSEGPQNLDLGELETIIEDAPIGRLSNHAGNRFSIPHGFSFGHSAPLASDQPTHDDSSLLALFARMQPLRASLDFLPMRLSAFHARAETAFPSACKELEAKRKKLETDWLVLEDNAEALRRELGEDRWVLVFRNAGRQAQKMCDSVTRSLSKLQEVVDQDMHTLNPTLLTKKIENFEAKKLHYGPAIERVLAIIEKGMNDRQTVNGEIIRLQDEVQRRWEKLGAEIRTVEVVLQEINLKKSSHFRDSVSSVLTVDRSVGGSAVNTPRSSPASSVVMTGANGESSTTPASNGKPRPGTFIADSTLQRPHAGRRYFSMPPGSVGSSHIPRKMATSSRPSTVSPTHLDAMQYAATSIAPVQGTKSTFSSPTPTGKRRPPLDGRPRWNSSVNTNDTVIGHNFKPLSLTTPSPHRKIPIQAGSARSISSVPASSPLGRNQSISPAANIPLNGLNNLEPRTSPLASREPDRRPSPSPARSTQSSLGYSHSSFPSKEAGYKITGNRVGNIQEALPSRTSQQTRPSIASRPTTSMASTRRSSMLPQQRAAQSGRESPAAMAAAITAMSRDRRLSREIEKPRWK